MVDWYHSVYDKARTIEGASQRVQEDTIKFSRIMEGLGTSFISAVMIIVEFLPILFGLSVGIPIFFFGDWEYGLVVGALIWSVGGTLFLVGLGLILRLVGVEYDLSDYLLTSWINEYHCNHCSIESTRPDLVQASFFHMGTASYLFFTSPCFSTTRICCYSPAYG